MEKTGSSKVIPSKVTDDYWVHARSRPDEEERTTSDNARPDKSPTSRGEGELRQNGTASNASEHSGSSADDEKSEGSPEGGDGLVAVIDKLTGLEILGEPEEQECYGGKWMLFFDQSVEDEEGCTQHDRAWLKVAQLCTDGNLHQAKASTALKDPMAHTQDLGCICCYTTDYRDQEEVRIKADLIRSALEEELQEKVIYYKTESATLANKYRILGSGRVSIYRHKPDYSFWKTSQDNTSWDILHSRNRRIRRFNRPGQGHSRDGCT